MPHQKVLAFVLAGGKGERLFPLTAFRSKPAVPFGGRYRIVDFVLSNLVNSQIFSIYLLVQYKSQSLIEHIRQHWVMSPIVRDHFIAVVPPQMRMGPEWFQGTADAILQNINLITQQNPRLVVVFGADHIYRMDIRQMMDFHLANNADVTVAARPVPVDEASAFGVIQTDADNRIVGFQEKPENPTPMPTDPTRAYVSMGNYIFSKDVLISALVEAQQKKHHDFGSHILPDLVKSGKLFAYDFATNTIPGTKASEETGYWRDVGTIKALFEAHMDMLGEEPQFELNNLQWPIYPSGQKAPASKIMKAEIINSMISEGVTIKDAVIKNSVIRTGVVIEEGVVVEDSILMDNSVLKKGCHLKGVIVDKLNNIKEGSRIGFAAEDERFGLHVDPSGIRVIPRRGWRDGQ
ncbi:Glucose-1-phosphate adenylyltransferase [hydrothermal vent metagenome]|uniref:Glucose-1-phosphate adenylyltransferase n=1 Tax=hydrothermal vent metagenome TaxID=652676 RepID=A0A3B1DEM5_9ZZZZ